MNKYALDIIEHCGPLLSNYKALICDVWGVLHDGVTAYESSNETLTKYRAQGGTVVLLTNSPQLSWQIKELLGRKKVWQSVYDAIVSSGDLTVDCLQDLNIDQVYHIGPERHAPIFELRGTTRLSSLEKAQAIVCTGFFIEPYDDVNRYDPLLRDARRRDLPFICANPDLIVDVGGELYPCAGMIAARYEELGGKVEWAGKPHLSAYREAQQKISALRDGALGNKDILVIGDALRTDMVGAHAAGLDALFIAQGIHREDVCKENHIDKKALYALFAQYQLSVRAAAAELRW